MLISEKLNAAINAQIGREFGASNQYLATAAYFDRETLPELAKFFYRQSDEERMHALKFLHYVVDTDGRVTIPAVEAPQSTIGSALAAAELSLKWELEVTRQINNLVEQAIKDNDYLAQDFLKWYVNEQLEEVSSMEDLVSVIKRAGEGGLLLVEDYLTRRGSTGGAPAPEAGT